MLDTSKGEFPTLPLSQEVCREICLNRKSGKPLTEWNWVGWACVPVWQIQI